MIPSIWHLYHMWQIIVGFLLWVWPGIHPGVKGFSSFFLTMRCCLCDRIKQRRSPAHRFLWPKSGYELRDLCLYALLGHILYTFFYRNSDVFCYGFCLFFLLFLYFPSFSILWFLFFFSCCFFTFPLFLSQCTSLCFFHTVYLSRSHPCCLKNFNESYKPTVSTHLGNSCWPYPFIIFPWGFVMTLNMVCFKKTYYINRCCPLLHNEDATSLLALCQ